jgi:UDP-2,3-diacylglucosamine hydrolase
MTVAASSEGLPAFQEIHASVAWTAIDFISDLHLAEDTPHTFQAFADYLLNTAAEAVFILGDLFEVWVGDDSRHGGFEARCAEVLTAATSRRSVFFMAGNRDFLVGLDMLQACGVAFLPDPAVLDAFGQRWLLSHGDALCLADTDYQQFRAEVRTPVWQQRFLALPLATRREKVRQIREESQRRKALLARDEWIDVDAGAAVRWMAEAGTPVLIHGHTHAPGSQSLAPGFVRHVLSDWDLDHAGEAPRAEVLRLQRSGVSRLSPDAARPSA